MINIKEAYKKIKEGIEDFFFGRHKVKQILVKEEVIEDIMSFAKLNHPKEFVAFLGGEVKGDSLIITHLIYQHYSSSSKSAFTRINLPMVSGVVGTVHSHPGPSNQPSEEDLLFFGKMGMIHLIIKYPYNYEDIAAYDYEGNPIVYDIY